MVRGAGLEPASLAAKEPKSFASANSASRASIYLGLIYHYPGENQIAPDANHRCGAEGNGGEFFIPGLLFSVRHDILWNEYGAIAQLARASHWQCEGREFESLLLHHF